ncbi:MAG: hypothetical protein KU38_11090 [Sulfurovum sp. FS08-3]|nr:MAG: hypothetical protein KU38_11090 [Sulfurovum sp. FS08-3]
MIEYWIYFILTLALSTLFAVAGLGSAIALVPLLNLLGLPFDTSRALGLFVNFLTTVTTSFLNFKKNLLDKEFVLPLVISSMITAFVGAKLSLNMDTEVVKKVFGFTLLILASMMLFIKIKAKGANENFDKRLLLVSGSMGGFFSGFLGIGGGSIISPILIFLGYEPKKIAIGITFVIPFSSIVAFGSYATVVDIDLKLLAIVSLGAIMGGSIGNYLLHFKVSSQTIKKLIALVLYILAFKMILG